MEHEKIVCMVSTASSWATLVYRDATSRVANIQSDEKCDGASKFTSEVELGR